MTTRSLFQIVIQYCGLYFVYQAILQLLKTLTYIFIPSSQQLLGVPKEFVFFQIIALLIYTGVGFTLLFTARSISYFFSHKDDKDLINLKKQNIIEVFIIVLGISAIMRLIPDIYPILSSLSKETDSEALINTLITIIVNVIIIYKARFISTYIMKVNKETKKEDY